MIKLTFTVNDHPIVEIGLLSLMEKRFMKFLQPYDKVALIVEDTDANTTKVFVAEKKPASKPT